MGAALALLSYLSALATSYVLTPRMMQDLAKHKQLIIVGDAAFAEIAYEYFTYDSPYSVAGFAVERAYLTKESLFGLPVVALEEVEKRFAPGEHEAFVALTYAQLNRVRARLCGVMKERGYRLASYVSSRAFVWRNVQVGENTFIFEDNTVQPFVTIGSDVILWSGNHIGHHSAVEDHCFISSHVVVSGFCRVGAYTFMGVNATVANNVTIGKDNFVGLGAVIAHDTPDNALVKGAPSEVAEGLARRVCKVKA